jgi:hypothetical protein
MHYKPIPKVGEVKRYSNKKYRNPRSGQRCKVLIVSRRTATMHNCLIEFEDGYKAVVSKWNLF